MKRVAVGNPFFLQTGECCVKVRARKGKRQMLISFGAPGRELNREIVTNSDYREWPILTFQFKSENVDIEINAGSNFVDVKNNVIDRRHGLMFFRLEPLPRDSVTGPAAITSNSRINQSSCEVRLRALVHDLLNADHRCKKIC